MKLNEFIMSLSIVLIAFDVTKIRRIKHEGISFKTVFGFVFIFIFMELCRFIAKYHIIALKEMAIIHE